MFMEQDLSPVLEEISSNIETLFNHIEADVTVIATRDAILAKARTLSSIFERDDAFDTHDSQIELWIDVQSQLETNDLVERVDGASFKIYDKTVCGLFAEYSGLDGENHISTFFPKFWEFIQGKPQFSEKFHGLSINYDTGFLEVDYDADRAKELVESLNPEHFVSSSFSLDILNQVSLTDARRKAERDNRYKGMYGT